ncbi:hypothetical protein RJT34_17888 [Clitoria ternatea]|uniref:C2 domain-containing protein n=1 Tax=Clitoria ternatea TaxID=43366 RepID=A0AAN9J9T0_CLITE
MDTITHRKRTLELTVLSLDELYVDPKLETRNLFVVVRAESIKCYTTGMATTGSDYERKPLWNEKLLVEMPTHARSITLEVKCKSSCVKDVGVARIALSDFLGDEVQFLSYRLRDWEGRRSGVLNFSVRVNSIEAKASSDLLLLGVPVGWNNYTCY